MENKKYTAVESLIIGYFGTIENLSPGFCHSIRLALQLEKEQIRKAYYKGVRDEWEGAGRDFEDFYNENYGTPR